MLLTAKELRPKHKQKFDGRLLCDFLVGTALRMTLIKFLNQINELRQNVDVVDFKCRCCGYRGCWSWL